MTIKETLIQLALGSLSDDHKWALTDNSNTPKEILKILSKDKNWEIRRNVALNRNTPIEILNILSTDEHWIVKFYATRTPTEILEELNLDDDC